MDPNAILTVIAYNDENRYAIVRDQSGQVGMLRENLKFSPISEGQAQGAVLKYNFQSLTPVSMPASKVGEFVASLP